MEYLGVLQVTLSQTCDVICATQQLTRDEVFEETETFIQENSRKWRLPNPEIDYQNAICRMAYIYMNVPIHAHLVEQAFAGFNQLEDLIRSKISSGEEIRVCALGGGPGSELMGLVAFIEKLSLLPRTAFVDFLVVDEVKEWDESWHALKSGVDSQLKALYGDDRSNWPVLISRSFLPLNAVSITDFQHFATRFSGIDIFVFSYFISEIRAYDRAFRAVLSLLMARAQPKALLLFVDRNQREVRKLVEKLIEDDDRLTMLGLNTERGRHDFEFSELGEWYIHLPSIPRQRWLSFFALAQRAN